MAGVASLRRDGTGPGEEVASPTKTCATGPGGGGGGSPGPKRQARRRCPVRRGGDSSALSSVAEVVAAPRPCAAVVEGRQWHLGFVRAWQRAGGVVVGLAIEGGMVGPDTNGGMVFFLFPENVYRVLILELGTIFVWNTLNKEPFNHKSHVGDPLPSAILDKGCAECFFGVYRVNLALDK